MKTMDAISTYVGPLLGLFGTLVAVGFGYFQWRKQHGNPNRAIVADAKKTASENVWRKLEEVNLRLRAAPSPETARLPLLLREVNSVFLANSLYLQDDQQAAVNAYVKAMHHVSEMVNSAGDDDKSEWSNTAALPLDASSPELRAAFEQLSTLRGVVKSRLVDAAGG